MFTVWKFYLKQTSCENISKVKSKRFSRFLTQKFFISRCQHNLSIFRVKNKDIFVEKIPKSWPNTVSAWVVSRRLTREALKILFWTILCVVWHYYVRMAILVKIQSPNCGLKTPPIILFSVYRTICAHIWFLS